MMTGPADSSSWLVVPLSRVSAQSLRVTLDGLFLRIDLQQRASGLYFSLQQDGAPMILNRLCLDRTWLIRAPYLNAPGDFAFIDRSGSDDPVYSGLSERFQLIYASGQNAL